MQGEDGLKRNINLEKTYFRKLDAAECNMVMIPASRHADPDCRMALQTELEKLKQFKAYEIVDDVGQYRISSTAIYWYKGEEVRARLVARGFEERSEVPSDSPTADKSMIRVLVSDHRIQRCQVSILAGMSVRERGSDETNHLEQPMYQKESYGS